MTDAHRNDPYQRPEHYDAAAREAEALSRIDRAHGPAEWLSAMLALALPVERFAAAAAGIGAPARIADEVYALRAGAKRRTFALLVRRAAAWPTALRRARLREWRQRLQTREPALAWRVFVARHACAPQRGGRATLADQAAAAHAATRVVAAALGLPPDARGRWLGAAEAALTPLGAPSPQGRSGLAPPVPQREQFLALRVRRLSPMQRPLLARSWLTAAEATGVLAEAQVADALHAAFVALDLQPLQALLE
ncbi:MAG TPA: hypothetical protein VFQ20_02120 [Burkholderiaceae bacterium]|nr:hypothetical protein [Burkholderiaceae bacterium]